MAALLGIDVSAFQTVDYAKAATKLDFLIAKATEGQHTTSSAWLKHWSGARTAGLLRGSYHLAHPSQSSATDEADFYAATLKSAGFVSGRDLPPMLDIEPSHGLTTAALTVWAKAFLERVDAKLGLTATWLKCGVYIGDSAPSVDRAAITEGRVFWRGTYSSTADHIAQTLKVPTGCSIAQWVTQVSQVPGVQGSSLDRDIARPEDIQRMAPAWYATTEETMALTTADVKKIWTDPNVPNRNDPDADPAGMATPAGMLSNIEATQDVDHHALAAVQADVAALKTSLPTLVQDAVAAALAAGTVKIDLTVNGVKQ